MMVYGESRTCMGDGVDGDGGDGVQGEDKLNPLRRQGTI